MRRLLSLVLLAAFGLPAVAPALALGQDTESSLPACCRRHGAHHCSMQRTPSSAPAFSELCPSFPQPSTTPSQSTGTTLVLTTNSVSFEFFVLTAPQQADAQPRISRTRSHHKRGPPTALLA